MKRTLSLDRLVKIGQILLLVGVSGYVLVYLGIALARLSFPFELEWMEGGSVVHVQRVLNGQPLYVAPTLDFIPSIYTPLYFYLSSLVARMTGNGFFPLRALSFLASIGCFALIILIVHQRTASRNASFTAVCLFAATFRISGSWFDLARVDTLFLFLLLAGVYAFDSPRRPIRALLAPALVFLAFFTKQTGLILGAALSAVTLLTRKRSERFLFSIIFGVLVAGSTLIMNRLTDGWYAYYVFDLPAQHDILEVVLVRFWTNDLAKHLAIALCLGVIPFLGIAEERSPKVTRFLQDGAVLGSLFLIAYLPRIHAGGFDNVLMPAYAGVAIYFGFGLATSLKAISPHANLKALLLAAIAIQFASLIYSPGQEIPTPKDRQQGEQLMALISSFEGQVYLSAHPWYLEKLGKPSQAQDMAVRDVLRASDAGLWKQALRREMAAAVADQRYDAFIVDFEDFKLRPADFEEHYELGASDLSGDAFYPVTGWDRRPSYLYLRRSD
jgi:hypothetical protein